MDKDKPLGRKAYGSIGHIANSRLGPGDHSVSPGQTDLCIGKVQRKDKVVYVQSKLDGSCCAVAKLNGEIIPLGRAGYVANTSPFLQHKYFHDWVIEHKNIFDVLLEEGERAVGEWLSQAHGTIYDLNGNPPFVIFDIMTDAVRLNYTSFLERICLARLNLSTLNDRHLLRTPSTVTGPMPPEEAMRHVAHYGARDPEGVMYRVEDIKTSRVDFLAKWVRADKIDGLYLPEITGKDPIWNWLPTQQD